MGLRIPPRATNDARSCLFIHGNEHNHPTETHAFVGRHHPRLRTGIDDPDGLLTIICAITAAVQGYSLGELYVQYFPIFRGGGASTSLPRLAYVIFSIYVVAAAKLAIVIRRRLSH